jgi:hypothetical protein
VISYELYCQIRFLYQERGLNFAQIARELHLDEETVAKWARAKSYTIARSNMQRKSKLDPYKILIQRGPWLIRFLKPGKTLLFSLRVTFFELLLVWNRWSLRLCACAKGVPY